MTNTKKTGDKEGNKMSDNSADRLIDNLNGLNTET